MPLFITFEGGEGCGKSLQSKTLFRKLERLAIPSILIHEPGGTLLGERVRKLLKQASDISISPLTELLLFNASRSQLVGEVIQTSLKKGQTVICDRFTDSTVAYQHYGRGLELQLVDEVNRIASQECRPNVTFLLDAPPEIGLSRKRPDAQDRFEQEDLDFHRKVRAGFLKMAAQEPDRWVVIDSTLSRSKIAGLVWKRVERLFSN
jgi:dTMP kinase